MSTDRLTIVCLMRPKPGQVEPLRTAVLSLVEPTRAEAGCIAYDLYEEADGSLVLVEQWRTQAELAAHQQQPAVRAVFGDRLSDLLDGEMGVHYGAPLEPTA